MLTPSLACAMPVCADDSRAEMTASQPCAEHHSGQDSAKIKSDKVNLILDCMGVDLQKVDTASVDKPNLKTHFVVYTPAKAVIVQPVTHINAAIIRGPPPNRFLLSQSEPSILLTTQRFRI
ncbi:MAG: hypothetical protein IT559_02035 [Alphaproteobacteria bacterium]|nr:hypothetical protein [Alphaproteobacteria bacterium]